jgi:hypothetical protein
MKGLFNIPETKEEIQKLINEIVSRNQGSAALEILYAIELTRALLESE